MSHPFVEPPLLLVIGWNDAEYSEKGRQSIVALATHLRDSAGIRACLAAAPAEPAARQWLFSFLGSLKRAMGATAGIIIRASELGPGDLTASSTNGLDEVVIIQDTPDPEAAIETVRRFQQSGTPSALGIRIWLDVPGTSFHSLTCAWKYATHAALRVELPPFRQISSNGIPPTTRGESQQLACEWLRTTITVSSHGEIVPCPAYLTHHAPGKAQGERPPADIAVDLAQRRNAWMGTGGSHPVCASCNRLVRFAGPFETEIPAQPVARILPAPAFIDHVGRDASQFSDDDRANAMRKLLERVHAAGGLGPS